jgi:hypothetical protein
MMKKILLGFAFIIYSLSLAQKVKTKKEIVIVDGKEFLKAKEDGVSRGSYIISSLGGQELFYLKFNDYKDPKEVDYKYNQTGAVIYFDVLSADLNTSYFESDVQYGNPFGTTKPYDIFVKILFNGKAINIDGTINQDKLEIISKKLGFKYSKQRDELGSASNGSNTVIIQESRPRNGFNISLGR